MIPILTQIYLHCLAFLCLVSLGPVYSGYSYPNVAEYKAIQSLVEGGHADDNIKLLDWINLILIPYQHLL